MELRNKSFYALVAAIVIALGVFWHLEGADLRRGFRAMAAFHNGQHVLRNPALVRETKLELAGGFFDEALTVAPPELDLGESVAKSYLSVGAGEQALAVYMMLLPQHGSDSDEDVEFVCRAAQLAFQVGDVEAADILYGRLMQLDPTDPNAYNTFGYLLAVKNVRLDEAEELIRISLELHAKRAKEPGGVLSSSPDPADLKASEAAITDSLGWVYYQRGEYEKAVKELEKAMKLADEAGRIATVEMISHLEQAREALVREGMKSEP
jgi:Flp pilus assembly protein TadD